MLRRSKTSQKSGVFQSKDGEAGSGDGATLEQLEGEINHWLGVKRALFGEVLLQAGVIDADQLTNALAYQQQHGGLLGEVLGLSEQVITDALGAQFHIKGADLRNENPSREALEVDLGWTVVSHSGDGDARAGIRHRLEDIEALPPEAGRADDDDALTAHRPLT